MNARRRPGSLTLLAAAGLLFLFAPATSAARDPAAPPEFFGVSPQTSLEQADFERMAAAGVGTLRFELSWAAADTGPDGALAWSRSDEIVRRAAAHGIQTLPFVFSTPDRVAAMDGHDCQSTCATYAPSGDAALAAWREFLAAATRRYGPGGTFWSEHPELPPYPVRAWQLWNEQNSPTFFKPRPNVDAYAVLVRNGHEAITSVDPAAEIVLGGMFGTPLGGRKPAVSAARFLGRLYRRPGIGHYFDGVGAHPYAAGFDKVLAQVEALRERMEQAGDASAGLWITEIGWASAGAPNPLNRGPAGQAQRLRRSFKYFLKNRRRMNIRTVNWYSWRDNPELGAGLCGWCPYSGLVTADLSEKPSLKVFTRLTNGS